MSPSLVSILLLLQDHDFSQHLSAKTVDYQLDMIKVQLFYLPREKAKKNKRGTIWFVFLNELLFGLLTEDYGH